MGHGGRKWDGPELGLVNMLGGCSSRLNYGEMSSCSIPYLASTET
jgi:hypothetical protein